MRADDRKVYLVHHHHTIKDLSKYGPDAGETDTRTNAVVAAFDTKEDAEAFVERELADVVKHNPKFNVRDILNGGRGMYRSSKVGREAVKRGERHEFRVYWVPYTPAALPVPAAV